MNIMGFKILGSIMISVGGLSSAIYMNNKAERALKEANAWMLMIKYIRAQIDSLAMSATEILSRCDESLISDCGCFLPKKELEGFKDLINACTISDSVIRKTVTDFFESFGKTIRAEQIKECEYYIQLISDRRKYLAETVPKKKRVNATLCVAASLAIIILML